MPDIKLPAIEIPKFDGGFKYWMEFSEIFTKVIHQNTGLSNAQRLQYLKTYTTGGAASLIKHLTIMDGNYPAAWDLLQKRYDNKRMLVNTQIGCILTQSGVSADSTIGLKNLHDITRECLFALKNLGVDTSSWDPIILFILLQKLDRETLALCEQSLENPKEMQTLVNFFSFIERRFSALATLRVKTISSNNRTASERPVIKVHSAVMDKCPFCGKDHKIYYCDSFKQQTVDERSRFIREQKLCINCLTVNHGKSRCNCHA